MLPVGGFEVPELRQMATEEALAQAVDPDLVAAIVTVESSWRPEASRYEPNWKYLFFVKEWSEKTGVAYEEELAHQTMSLGLMQIMGSVARELGYDKRLCQLFEPRWNLRFGVMKLKTLLNKYPSETDVISSYNQGSPRKTAGGHYQNQAYVDAVSNVLRDARKLKP